eukprot:ANDGO_04078.mRNA.1 hypothetical protein EMIHUDRAFT_217878
MGRTLDAMLALVFLVFFIVAIGVDGINAVIPGEITAASISGIAWPPKIAAEGILFWCQLADPLLCKNPMWLRCAAAYSPILYGPFYLFAIYAFARRRNWIRVPALLWSAHLLNTLTLLTAEALYGEHPSPNMGIFAAAYGSYVLVPLYILIRMAAGPPFPYPSISPSRTKKTQ